MQPEEASTPRNSSDHSLPSKKPESRTSKGNDNRSKHQITNERDQEMKSHEKDNRKTEEEFFKAQSTADGETSPATILNIAREARRVPTREVKRPHSRQSRTMSPKSAGIRW